MSATFTDNRNLEEVCAWQEERIKALYARMKELEVEKEDCKAKFVWLEKQRQEQIKDKYAEANAKHRAEARMKQLEALLEAKGDVSTRRIPASEH